MSRRLLWVATIIVTTYSWPYDQHKSAYLPAIFALAYDTGKQINKTAPKLCENASLCIPNEKWDNSFSLDK
jgi:hypothetical protein